MNNEYLLRYRTLGLNIIPIPIKQKFPVIEWKPYQSMKYEGDFNPTDNIGIICGAISGNFVCIDIDSNVPEKINIIVPNAVVKTPVIHSSRGYHIWLRSDKTVKTGKLVNREGDIIIDIKGEGSIIVAPPSVHPSGAVYRQINPKVQTIAIVDFSALFEHLTKLGFKRMNKGIIEGTAPIFTEKIRTGERNTQIHLVAGLMYRLSAGKLNSGALLAAMLYVNNQICEPALSQDEVKSIVSSIIKTYKPREINNK